jgi:DNA helicase-4
MSLVWKPSKWGRVFTRSDNWQVSLKETGLEIFKDSENFSVQFMDISEILLNRGIFWSKVRIVIPSKSLRFILKGIPNTEARNVASEFQKKGGRQASSELQSKTRDMATTIRKEWLRCALALLPTNRWISRDDVYVNLFTNHIYSDELKELISSEVEKANKNFLKKEIIECRSLFDKVEKSPLTEEQANAVVCFENRVLAVAAAGSGKTSTLIVKAAYALHRNLIAPDEILMLAFNKDAADEMQQRIKNRLSVVIKDPSKVAARTLHAFGLRIIGEATGKMPELAKWLEADNGVGAMADIVKSLSVSDQDFKQKWEFYKTVYAEDLPDFDEKEEPEDWDSETKAVGFRTRNGEVVKSREELMLADWLFYNGVEYIYEGRYKIDTADAQYRQYRPDFYYPAIDLYHEHYALDEKGNPPKHFTGYLDKVKWKRKKHEECETECIETTSFGLRSGTALSDLAKQLEDHGIKLNPQVDRPAKGRALPKDAEIVGMFRVFQTHVKNNRLDIKELRQRSGKYFFGYVSERKSLFLDLFEKVSREWEERLKKDNYIDFEDMLNLATDFVESGKWTSPYRLVMVDEFQDTSQARARLIKALVDGAHRYLFAVGDDWQGINRFAGADIGVMANFEKYFGEGERVYLTQTFRCPQNLCDVAGAFVMRNPIQIRKEISSISNKQDPSIICYAANAESSIELTEKHLNALYKKVEEGTVKPSTNSKVSVFILGRYNMDRPACLAKWKRKYAKHFSLNFSTVHGSKGREVDYVFLINVVKGKYGFPSRLEDDSLIKLAMPAGDSFPFAEERRLFYVALTRAKRLVIIYTFKESVSEFLEEIRHEPFKVELQIEDGSELKACPKCKAGNLVCKRGPHGSFMGCSNWPTCAYSFSLRKADNGSAEKVKLGF